MLSSRCPGDERLLELAAGHADPSAAAAIEEHIDACDDCRRALSAIAAGAAPAASFGRYHVRGVLGSGGMGIVYRAWDPELQRAVAIKVVRRAGDEAARTRLAREAQSLARLSHRHVCQVHDVGTEGDEVWVAMELIEGETLRAWAQRSLARGELLAALVAVAEGLAAAHAAGIIHRDVKPENVLIARDGRAVVTDFGLARAEAPGDLPAGADPTTSALAGTPAYLAPEQLAGKPFDARVDQFAWAVMAWELVTGARPFPPGAGLDALHPTLTPPPSLPRPLAAALRRALSAEPDGRFPTMDALIAALRPALPRPPGSRRRLALLAAPVALVLAGGAWLVHSTNVDPAAACARDADRVHAVWNPARAAALRAAFAATGQPFAADTADRVAGALDRFATAFAAQTADACDATFHRGAASQRALDLRRACLAHALDRVGELLHVFEHPDAKIVKLAVNAADAVTDLDACRDASGLLARQDEPADPRVRARIAELRAELARAEALHQVADYRHALAVANDAATGAEQLAYFPLRAEAAYRVGLEHRELGENRQAEEAYRRAVAAAEAGRDDLLAASAWTRLISAARAEARYDDAARFADQAKAKLERVGNPPAPLAFYEVNLALLEQSRGELAAARHDYERALALYEPLGAERPRVVSVLGSLANVYGVLGLHDLQLRTAERAAALAEKVRGPDHPLTAQALVELAVAQGHAGAHAKAIATLERARGIRARVYGEQSNEVAGVLNDLAGELVATGDLAGARAKLEQALAIRTKVLGPDRPETVTVELNLARVLTQASPRDAIAHLEHVLAVRSAQDPQGRAVGLVLDHLAVAQAALGQRDAARASFSRALAIFSAKLGPAHPLVAMVWSELGNLELDARRPAAAVAALEHAVAIDARGQRQADDAALDHFLLAQALWRAGRQRGRARALATAAHDALAHVDGAGELRGEIEAWLAGHRLE